MVIPEYLIGSAPPGIAVEFTCEPVFYHGPAGAPIVTRIELMNPPTQEREVEMITGESHAEIAEKLADKIFAEKVL